MDDIHLRLTATDWMNTKASSVKKLIGLNGHRKCRTTAYKTLK